MAVKLSRHCCRVHLLRRTALVLALLTSVHSAHALQVLNASDGVAIEALLSIQEPTRIRIEGTPITDVFGNLYSSQCAALPAALPNLPGAPATTGTGTASPAAPINPAGEIVLECDRDKGEIYVRPVGQGTKPVNLFVSSAYGTYTLLLRRTDTPADTIVIRDSEAAQRRIETAPPTSGSPANHVRGLKAMLVAMATDHVPHDVQIKDIGQPVTLWREVRFVLERTYQGRGLIGERYQLQNVSHAAMVLMEAEFDREDSPTHRIAGVAIEHHNLRPGEQTQVFVIRKEVRP
jgi:conjugal transfer pilus assembly protein TraK